MIAQHCNVERSRTRQHRNAGFSLLEMLVVLAILALVATVVLPTLVRPSEGLRLQASARELIAALRVARAAAISRNIETVLTVDVDRRSFASPTGASGSFAPEIAAELKVAEPERVSRSRGGLRFYPDGSSTGGDVALSLRGKQARVCVDWLTGAARQSGSC
jgi:general secretion pathway protein H